MSGGDWGFPNPATPPGSSAYYSVRFAPPPLRVPIAVLFAWRRAMRDVLTDCSDPGVARLKLQWWRDELQRAADNRPLHPLGKALVPLLARFSLPFSPLLEIADRAESDVRSVALHQWEDLVAHCASDYGALFELIGHCYGTSDAGQYRQAGAYTGVVRRLRNLGIYLRRGHNPMPSAFGEPFAGTWLTDLTTHIECPDFLDCRLQALPPTLAAHTAISRALLRQLEKNRDAIMNQRIDLAPLRKLWIAWRTR